MITWPTVLSLFSCGASPASKDDTAAATAGACQRLAPGGSAVHHRERSVAVALEGPCSALLANPHASPADATQHDGTAQHAQQAAHEVAQQRTSGSSPCRVPRCSSACTTSTGSTDSSLQHRTPEAQGKQPWSMSASRVYSGTSLTMALGGSSTCSTGAGNSLAAMAALTPPLGDILQFNTASPGMTYPAAGVLPSESAGPRRSLSVSDLPLISRSRRCRPATAPLSPSVSSLRLLSTLAPSPSSAKLNALLNNVYRSRESRESGTSMASSAQGCGRDPLSPPSIPQVRAAPPQLTQADQSRPGAKLLQLCLQLPLPEQAVNPVQLQLAQLQRYKALHERERSASGVRRLQAAANVTSASGSPP